MPFIGKPQRPSQCGKIAIDGGRSTEAEAKEALESTVSEASQEIDERQARKQWESQKATLMQVGVAEVSHYLWQLKEGGEISSDEFWNSDFRADLQEAVREELQAELTGDESTREAKELARDIIEDELR